ncbi:hemeolysin-III related [Corynebacterium heidelbergense]|nr:hemeolysin-III related [Corynebacterium heidelbergense]
MWLMSSQTAELHTERRNLGERARRAVDRGPRPYFRGRLHASAAWFFGGSSTALTAVAAAHSGSFFLTLTTAVYAMCLVGMLTVSALYHRVPWRSESTIQHWRRADHAMIAIFIVATYGPITAAAFGAQWFVRRGGIDALGGFMGWGGSWLLLVGWLAAAGAVVLNLFWITHPRWLAVTVYMVLGWMAVFGVAAFYHALGLAPSLLILLGGVVYSLGAIVYGKKWPNPSERWFGFHELFHAATILAAGLHHIAIWLVVLD